MEIWKDVKGYEGLYQVSNLGNVKTLNYRAIGREKILKPSLNSGGYLLIGLQKNGHRKSKDVHQLVAIAFLNHKPCGFKLIVNHKDFDKTNNAVFNLEIITQRANKNHSNKKYTSKYPGVYWKKANNKWIAQIHINGCKKYLGLFDCETDAHNAYQKELLEIK